MRNFFNYFINVTKWIYKIKIIYFVTLKEMFGFLIFAKNLEYVQGFKFWYLEHLDNLAISEGDK